MRRCSKIPMADTRTETGGRGFALAPWFKRENGYAFRRINAAASCGRISVEACGSRVKRLACFRLRDRTHRTRCTLPSKKGRRTCPNTYRWPSAKRNMPYLLRAPKHSSQQKRRSQKQVQDASLPADPSAIHRSGELIDYAEWPKKSSGHVSAASRPA